MRLQLSRILYLLSGVFLIVLHQLTICAGLSLPLTKPQIGENSGEVSISGVEGVKVETEEALTGTYELQPTDQTTPKFHEVHRVDTNDLKAFMPTESQPSPTTSQTMVHCISVAHEPPLETPTPFPHIEGEFLEDVFSIEDRRRGWVILHIIGMIYMFVALAVVCNEFFVPALGVISHKLAISDDVVGATFMAAGRSIPKFFTSLTGAFIAHSNVGVGKIVGSAVFNILFVIGMCALFSREILHLTWWPLFRDMSFYILDLILLIIFFLDNAIMWWESMMLVASYTLYVIFLKFNAQIKQACKTRLQKHKNLFKSMTEKDLKMEEVSAEDVSGHSEDCDIKENNSNKNKGHRCKTENDDEMYEEEKGEKPLSLKWPETLCKQAAYLFLLPIVFPLWLTLADVRTQKSRKFFASTFLGSILWIAVFSYLLVWWAHQVSETFGISQEIMGLTVLAAGTSMPDLITSVIVARKGLGDMVLSSCVGNNIFNITLGLPVPWLLCSVVHGLVPVVVSSDGLFCSVSLLFLMLLFVIICMVSCGWKMNKLLGFSMLLLYLVFVLLSLLLQYRFLVCPVA